MGGSPRQRSHECDQFVSSSFAGGHAGLLRLLQRPSQELPVLGAQKRHEAHRRQLPPRRRCRRRPGPPRPQAQRAHVPRG
eukprot:3776267-Alexandrium_andersonii.AAC.1